MIDLTLAQHALAHLLMLPLLTCPSTLRCVVFGLGALLVYCRACSLSSQASLACQMHLQFRVR